MNQPFSDLIEEIQKKISVSSSERKILESSFKNLSTKKNEYLVKLGAKTQHLYFISSGYVRCFYVDEEGNEITTDILNPKNFVTSFESFMKKEVSNMSLQCITPCELLSISKQDHENLYFKVRQWSWFCQGIYEKSIMKMQNRINILQSLSASERYSTLLKHQRDIALNASVKHLASYLGIKPQSLSRIRKEIK